MMCSETQRVETIELARKRLGISSGYSVAVDASERVKKRHASRKDSFGRILSDTMADYGDL